MSDVEKNIGTHKPEFDGEWVRLGDVCTKGKSNLRQKDLKNDGPYPVYGAPGIVGFSSNYQNADAYVAVVKDGAGVGRVMACEPRSSVLGTMQALLPGKGTDRDYLLHLVRSMDLGKGFTGSTIPHIYFKDYGKTLVRALSRGRQVEVANRLSGIDRLISQGKQQLSALNDLVKSQFVEMFGDPRLNTKEWPLVKLGDVASTRLGKMLDAKKQTGLEARPYLANTDVQWFRFNLENLKTMDFDAGDRKEFALRDGDVLATEGGEVGRCAIWHCELEECYFQKAVHRIRCDSERLLPIFLAWTFKMKSERNLFGSYVSRSTIAHLTGEKLRKVPIQLPPLALQQQFADFVARVDKLGFDKACREP